MFTLQRVLENSDIDTRNVSLLEDGWDWAVGNKDSLGEYLERAKEHNETSVYYWLIVDGEPQGIFGFLIHPELGLWSTSGFIHPDYRGQELNMFRLLLSAKAFQLLHMTLLSSIRLDNERSWHSLEKSGFWNKSKIIEEYRGGLECYIYILTDGSTIFSKFEIPSTELFDEAVNVIIKDMKVLIGED